jgi:putative peptide zinc metalloprotease protein
VLQAKLPDFHAFFHAGNILWLAAALAAAKVLHEFGHALTCRHFGGECHEMGLLLLVFTPCLYSDVSDTWSFSSRWQRIAVSAAGIVVEVYLAAAATFLWWFSTPGLLNTLCLNVMFVCSINTLLFNGNPLLRYDGYYALADFLDVPNLGQQSRAVVGRAAARFFLGIRLVADRCFSARRRVLLASYGVASAGYRCFITICILWFCYRVAKPYGLQALAVALVWVVVAGMAAVPLWRLARFLHSPSIRRGIRWMQACFMCGAAIGGLLLLALVPWPCRVAAPAFIEPRDARPVYVVVAGRVVASVTPGEYVAKGQEVARLLNLDVRKEVVELIGQRDRQRLQCENLRRRRNDDPAAAAMIPTAEAALADIEERLRQRQRDEERLVLRAPVAGTVMPPPRQSASPGPAGQLNLWQGTPLDERNRGCHLEIGTLLCLVGAPLPVEALLVIDQPDVALVRQGQRVRIRLEEMPGTVLHGTVVEMAKADIKVVPRELVKGVDLPVRLDERGIPRPQATSYQARVALDAADAPLLMGTRGRARIVVDPQSPAQRLYRYLRRTFQWPL